MDDALRLRAHAARAEIAAGALRGAALLDRLRAVPWIDRDAWVDELLAIEPPPADGPELPRGGVPYLPCGVDEIVAMVEAVPVGADDELVDLGSGLGRVVMLAHLLSGARGRGIEVQAGLVDRARAGCAALGLSAISFDHGNAADAELDGSVFFLYSPFGGDTLARVVHRLEGVAQRRPIVVAAVGFELPAAAWLTARATPCRALTVYESCVPTVARRSTTRAGSLR